MIILCHCALTHTRMHAPTNTMAVDRMTAPPSSVRQKLHLNMDLNGCSPTTSCSCSLHPHLSHPARRQLPVSGQPVRNSQHFHPVCVFQNTGDGKLYESARQQGNFKRHVVAGLWSFNALPSSPLWRIHKKKFKKKVTQNQKQQVISKR